MAVWEYKTAVRPCENLLTDAEFNQFGAHGYELVNCFVVSEQITVLGRHETHHTVHCFFKRAAKAQ